MTPDTPPVALGGAIDALFALAPAMAPDGGVEIVFQEPAVTPFLLVFSTLKIQRFASDGTPVGAVTEASQAGNMDQINPAVAALAGGGFVVVWSARQPPAFPVDPAALDHGILMGRLLDGSGRPLGGDLQLGLEDDAATETQVAPLSGGGFVASCTKARPGRTVVFRLFDSAGRPLSGEVPLSNALLPRNVGLVPLADGGFVAGWGQGSQGFLLQRFDAAGSAVGPSWSVAKDPGGPARLAASPSGRLALAWNTTNPDFSKATAVEVATFDADGNPLSPQATVVAANGVFYPLVTSVAIDLRGRAVVSWNLWYGLGASAGFAQLYETTGEALGPATPLPGQATYRVQSEQIFAGNDGGWNILFWEGGTAQAVQHYLTATCSPAATSLCLAGDRFRLDATFGAGSGSATARPVPLTGDTGALWFFDRANPELVIKIIDGTAVNGHYWLFYGALTDVEFDLTVTDTATGQQRLYHNPAGTLASFADTEAFPPPARAGSGAPAGSAVPSAAGPARLGRGAPAAAAASPCHDGPANLCLVGSRFSATVSWQDPRVGAISTSPAVPLSGAGGYFWFFGPDDIEVSVKMLDGTAVNGHFWVFYGSLTDVEFDLTIVDTLSPTGATRTYHNPAHHLASAADTSAF